MELPLLHHLVSGDKAVAPSALLDNVAAGGQSVWMESSPFLASVCSGFLFLFSETFKFFLILSVSAFSSIPCVLIFLVIRTGGRFVT